MRPYHPHLDWLKSAGIALIVYGHVAAATTVHWTPPVYPKQLGVAFFVCAMGYTLAAERRSGMHVIFLRCFEMFFYGLVAAVAMSLIGWNVRRDIAESNYLPLLFGANVLLDDFPANPTTWFIGTYLHLLVLWALILRRFRVTGSMLVFACAFEIVVRALLLATDNRFGAYMLASNWLTVLLVGLWLGSRTPAERGRPVGWFTLAVVLAVGWPLLATRASWDLTFPLMTARFEWMPAAVATSILVTAVYVAYTLGAFRVCLHLPEIRIVRFLARNTLFVFIAHMPVYYGLEAVLLTAVPSYPLRVVLEFIVCLPVLAVLSEYSRKKLSPVAVRERISRWMSSHPEPTTI